MSAYQTHARHRSKDQDRGAEGLLVHSIVHVEDHVHVLACSAPNDLLKIFYYL